MSGIRPELRHYDKYGFVYAIKAANGLVKIGWARNPYDRMDEMLTGSAVELKLWGFVPGTVAQEAELLRLLRPWRSHREWFRGEGPVLKFLEFLPLPVPLCLAGRIWQGGDNGISMRRCPRIHSCKCITPEMPQFLEAAE